MIDIHDAPGGGMGPSEPGRNGRRFARMLLAVLMVPNLAACWLAAKATFDVVTDRFVAFSNLSASGALLAVVVAAVGAVAWLSIATWNGQAPRRVRLVVAYLGACAALWVASVGLALSTVDNSY